MQYMNTSYNEMTGYALAATEIRFQAREWNPLLVIRSRLAQGPTHDPECHIMCPGMKRQSRKAGHLLLRTEGDFSTKRLGRAM
jgi:hypothetical protein